MEEGIKKKKNARDKQDRERKGTGKLRIKKWKEKER